MARVHSCRREVARGLDIVETAGHAGTELGLSRLPVLKLLTGRAAIVGARGEPIGG